MQSSTFLVKAKHESNLEISFTIFHQEFGTTPVECRRYKKKA